MTAAAAVAQRRLPALPGRIGALLFLGVVAVLYLVFAGQWTLPHDDDAQRFHQLNDVRSSIDANRNSNAVLQLVFGSIRIVVEAVVDGFMLVMHAIPWLGWLGIGGALGFFLGGWRLAAVGFGGFLAFGVLGVWEASITTLAVTLAAVAMSLAIGIPLGIVAGRRPGFLAAIQPVLDVMQILPTFAYLPLVTLFFLIGPASAAIVTMIYAIPPAIRITALGIRGVAPSTVEAATSLGSTSRQLLTKVQLPMARRAIILGVNQTIMMALSMVVITALIDGPGLGEDVVAGIQQSDVGLALTAGIAIVVLAILLDRLTTAASERADPANGLKNPGLLRLLRRPPVRAAVVAIPVAAIAAGTALGGEFPDVPFSIRRPVNDAVAWAAANFYDVTEAIKNGITYGLINPIEDFLTTSPWWLVIVLVAGIALYVGGRRPAVIAGICFLGLIAMEVWEHAMVTLAQVLVATALTMGIGLALGVAAARSERFSKVQRPVLDTLQTMPAFVYLIPALAFFGPTRFTAILAAVIYAVPAVIRLVEIGIRTVPVTVREAATAAGATKRQLLWKVELPMARPALLVAANQGIVLVLAMVVIGGLVGGGGLGFDVVAGFSKYTDYGEGAAAAIACVLLGIALDRTTQGAGRANRSQRRRLLPAGAVQALRPVSTR